MGEQVGWVYRAPNPLSTPACPPRPPRPLTPTSRAMRMRSRNGRRLSGPALAAPPGWCSHALRLPPVMNSNTSQNRCPCCCSCARIASCSAGQSRRPGTGPRGTLPGAPGPSGAPLPLVLAPELARVVHASAGGRQAPRKGTMLGCLQRARVWGRRQGWDGLWMGWRQRHQRPAKQEPLCPFPPRLAPPPPSFPSPRGGHTHEQRQHLRLPQALSRHLTGIPAPPHTHTAQLIPPPHLSSDSASASLRKLVSSLRLAMRTHLTATCAARSTRGDAAQLGG